MCVFSLSPLISFCVLFHSIWWKKIPMTQLMYSVLGREASYRLSKRHTRFTAVVIKRNFSYRTKSCILVHLWLPKLMSSLFLAQTHHIAQRHRNIRKTYITVHQTYVFWYVQCSLHIIPQARTFLMKRKLSYRLLGISPTPWNEWSKI